MAISRSTGVVIASFTLATTAAAAPAIELEPTQINHFEQETEAAGPPVEFIIHNTGDAPLEVTDMMISGSDADQFMFVDTIELICGATQHCTTDFTVAPGEMRHSSIILDPTRFGDLAATLVVTSNAGNAEDHSTIPLRGIGVRHPVVAVSPSSLILPDTLADGGSSTARLTITNAALPPSAIVGYRTDGPPWQLPSQFTVSTECPLSGPCGGYAGESHDLVITFRPLSSGVINGTIVITPVGYPPWVQPPIEIPFHAEAGYPQLTIDQPANGMVLELPLVPVGMTSTATIVAHSSGLLSLFFWRPLSSSDPQITITGGPAPFESLAPGEVVTWQVSCTPTSTSPAGTQVFFDTNSVNQQQHLTIGCSGTAPALDARSPPGADVVVTPVGASTTRAVSVRNVGNQDTEIAAIIPSDPHFTVGAPGPPIALPAGGEVFVDLAFTPTAAGIIDAEIVFDSSAGGDITLSVRGTGEVVDPTVSLSAASVEFPDTHRHPVSPATQTVSLTNTGPVPLALTIATDGDGFSVLSPANAAIAPGASQDIVIGFSPTMVAMYTGHLIAGDASHPMLARIDLSGTGIARNLAVSPLAIDLGSVDVGDAVRLGELVAGGIAISNLDAAAAFTLSRVTISEGAFTLLGPDRAQLGPGDVAGLDVVFAPALAGSHAAAIEIFVDEDPEPHARIALTAQATEPEPEPTPPPTPSRPPPGGCAASPGSLSVWLWAGLVGLALRRRRGAAGVA